MSEPDLERSEIDGVTVLRADSPTGRSGAALIFRVGRFDETLPVAGITHLVEHLVFCGEPWPRYQFNGSVDGRFTTFAMTTADPGDIQGFVARVCEGLTSDWSAEIERESRVLRTEAAGRGQGMASSCLAERYGAAGPGLAARDELGLIKPDWERVEQWRGQWFVAGNATLCVLGDLPSGLRMPLPPGTAPELEPLRSYADDFPAYLVGGKGGIGLSMVGEAGPAQGAALSILQARLTQQLRRERGLSYQVAVTSERLDARQRHVWVAADALPDEIPMVAHVMLTVLEDLGANGPTEQELAGSAQQLRSALDAPDGAWQTLLATARSGLLNGAGADRPSLMARAEDLTTADIAAAMAELQRQIIVVTPRALPVVQGRMPALRIPPAPRVTGGSYPSRSRAGVLTVGPDGVSLERESELLATVRYDNLVAVLRWNDGICTLIGGDGYRIRLAPAEWQEGDEALSAVERKVPGAQVVRIDEAGPVASQLGPPPEPVASRAVVAPVSAASVQAALQKANRRVAVFLAVLLVWLVLAVMWLQEKVITPPVFALLVSLVVGINGHRLVVLYRRRRALSKARAARPN